MNINFKKATILATFLMTACGLPLSTRMKGKLIFKLILMAQIYAAVGDFYSLCRPIPPNEVHVTEVGELVQYVFTCLFSVVMAYVILVAHHHHGHLIHLMEQLDHAFDQLGPSPKTTRFLKSLSMQLKFWFLLISFSVLANFVLKIQEMADGPEVSFGFIVTFLNGININVIIIVAILMLVVLKCTAFLFDRLTTFRVDHDLKRLLLLIQVHRKCCGIARLTNRIFSSILSAVLIFNVYGLIGLLANDFYYIWPTHKEEVNWGFMFLTPLYLCLFVCVSFLSANVNHKLNRSLDYILSVGSSFQGPTLTTKKSLALMTKLDLYVTHVTLSGCYVGCGGVTEMKPKHIVIILGFILSYVVLLFDKAEKAHL